MNSFSNLPEYLIDSILQFTDVKDIINFSNTDKDHKEIVNDLTKNSCSFISTIYEITEVCDIETWILLPYQKYELKYAKQYYQIYKNIDIEYYLTFEEVNNVFCGLSKLIKQLYRLETDENIQEQYMYVFLTLFELIKHHIYLFNEAEENQQEIQRNILNFLIKIFNLEIPFIDTYKIYPHILEIFERLISNIEDYDKTEIQDTFEIDFIQSFFFYDEGNINQGMVDLYNDVMEIALENNLEQIILLPENGPIIVD